MPLLAHVVVLPLSTHPHDSQSLIERLRCDMSLHKTIRVSKMKEGLLCTYDQLTQVTLKVGLMN